MPDLSLKCSDLCLPEEGPCPRGAGDNCGGAVTEYVSPCQLTCQFFLFHFHRVFGRREDAFSLREEALATTNQPFGEPDVPGSLRAPPPIAHDRRERPDVYSHYQFKTAPQPPRMLPP
ncbi:hypothetical protein BS47DRAFT_943465 [Hydnum rufescens UP504]|uniref:Kazal-like domain-containing protein n=1 Tax=Hydnum rufescens UP504 TaxID=1448309 RepID=A0A9P6DXA0_9AGAM|nr:hypothetical protein BS47DRAFT_943465 [Hydnum rufescens UP504]